jgi:ribonuclease Z
MIPFKLTFLGTGGTIPTHRRALSAFYVVRGGDKWLFDCGEGTQRQLWGATGGLPDLDGIFLTHFHVDHTLGLSSILSTMALYGRTRPISLYGPRGMRDVLSPHVALMSKSARGLIRWCELGRDETAARMDDYAISTFPVEHARGRAVGYVIQEDDRPGHIDAALCAASGLSGPDVGRVKAGEVVRGVRPQDVMGPTQRGRKVVITGDTAYTKSTVRAAFGADLLIHDSTFLADQATDKDHSTAEDAGAVAKQAHVKRLACVHIATRNRTDAIEAEANKALGTNLAFVPRDLQAVEL